MKQLADIKSEARPENYITLLAGSPTDLLVQYPPVAANFFDKDNLPVNSPIQVQASAFIRSMIKLRPGRVPSRLDLQAPEAGGRQNQMIPEMMFSG